MIRTFAVFIINIASFIFIHNRFRFLSKYPPGWGRLTAYAVGVLFNFPFFMAHLYHKERCEIAYLLSFLGSGIGTAFGWMLEDNARS